VIEKIVVIEDEPDIQEVLRYNLSQDGHDVIVASDGLEGLNTVRALLPELVLLDLLLPRLDGLEVCRRLKSQATTREIPIIMLTAKGEERDIVLGLGLGADDYITKPFSPKEVLARVQAVLRRSQSARPGGEITGLLEFDGLTIEPVKHRVSINGSDTRLTATEFRLLHHLASHPERVFTREQLIDKAIGDRAVVIDRNIDVHIRAVRKKLGSYRNLIETVRGVGYRFQPRPT
jgi:phosphate regulon transcriptional regulator PhoB